MKKVSTMIMLMLLLFGCGKKHTPDPAPDYTPAKTILLAPASNSTCTVGTVISVAQSAVSFTWNTSTNAESYDINIRNLLTQVTVTQTTNTNQLVVTLDRNTPYAWYIVAKTSKTSATTSSDTWKFYNAGLAATNYAPFPADLTAPAFNQNVSAVAGKVTLSWAGADVDNDIVGYDVYLGTTVAGMAVISANQTASTFSVQVTSGTIYYWKTVTKDSQGNDSYSVISQFAVN